MKISWAKQERFKTPSIRPFSAGLSGKTFFVEVFSGRGRGSVYEGAAERSSFKTETGRSSSFKIHFFSNTLNFFFHTPFPYPPVFTHSLSTLALCPGGGSVTRQASRLGIHTTRHTLFIFSYIIFPLSHVDKSVSHTILFILFSL